MKGHMLSYLLAAFVLVEVVNSQNQVIFFDFMNLYQMKETTPEGTWLYNLRASYQGSSDNIEYGIEDEQAAQRTPGSIKSVGDNFRVDPDGSVYLVNSGIDLESDNAVATFIVVFIARVKGSKNPIIHARRESRIIILDENDFKPVIQYIATEEIFVNEGFVPQTPVVPNINVIDKDIESFVPYINVTCAFYSESPESCDLFEVRSTNLSTQYWSGSIYLKQPLDYEERTSWVVVLKASDGANEAFESFVINVRDVQDSPPIFIASTPTFVVFEEEQTTFIGQVQARDGDGDRDGWRDIYFTFIPDTTFTGTDYRDLFSIDGNTGVISRKVRLDLEAPPFNHAELSNWRIIIRACEILNATVTTPEGVPLLGDTNGLDCTEEIFNIKIEDINDNRPLFDKPRYDYVIRESISLSTYLSPSIQVDDADGEEFNRFNLSIVQNIPEFGVTGTSQIFNILVRDTGRIDFEQGQRTFNFTLLAVDRNDTSLRSQAEVSITVLDVNDNSPEFEMESYFATVLETAPPFTRITQVQARDPDSGLFGTEGLVYSLILSNLFQINSETGVIEVAECLAETYGRAPCLDYDQFPREYSGKVRVQDNRGNQGARPPVLVNIRIQILDVNDNPPRADDATASIFEQEFITTRPLIIQGTDADNDVLSYSILQQAPGDYWVIDSVTGNITANRRITLQLGKRFDLVVGVSDSNYTTRVNVVIDVLDINDNGPVFELDDYEISIPEDFPKGTSLLTVKAVDADDPTTQNGQINYYIQSGSGGKFEFRNSSMGEIFTTSDANFEKEVRDTYVIRVLAVDRGFPSNTAQATVTVNILDANNKNPRFNPFSQNVTIYDNTPNGTKIFTVTAEDPDVSSDLRYYFVEPKQAIGLRGAVVERGILNYTTYLVIDEMTGEVFLNTTELDAESTNLIIFQMRVVDVNATIPQNGLGTFTVDVKKFNVKGPRFINLPDVVFLEEERPVQEVVYPIIAVDPDGVISGYELVAQSDNYFAIEYKSGVVSVLNRIDYDDARKTNESYFVVLARDDGVPQLSVTGTVRVIFHNINDNTPQFVDSGSQSNIAVIDENSPTGTPTGIQVQATDMDRPDENGFATVFYTLQDPRFAIDNETGEISVNLQGGRILDRETQSSYRLNVRACDTPYDPRNVRRCRSTVAYVELRDQNDNAPEFSRDNYFKRIFETIGTNVEVLPLFTSDQDLGTNGQVNYQKVPGSGDPNDYFDVTRVTGRVYVKRDLVGHTGNYTFEVEARDENGVGPFSAIATVTIEVMPSANSPPEWVIPPKDNQTITVLEEQYLGMVVYKVKAIDMDSGNNGIVDYMFFYEGQRTNRTPEFYINSVTGVIHADIVFDRERVPRYVLLLVASDRGETKLEATRFLTITVKDVNDHAPYFKQNEIGFSLPENSSPGTYIGSVEAFDEDEELDIFYEIIAGNEDNVFALDRQSGVLTLAGTLDVEQKQTYYLDIQAKNEEKDYTVVRNRRRRATDPSIITVKISIGDVNDQAPQFLSSNYYGCISTRSSYNKHIVTIQAIDRDAVGTGIVRFRLTGGNRDGSKQLFEIHPKFGVISNSVLMEPYVDRTFLVDVEVRDAELLENAETATTQAKIFVTTPDKEARLLIKQNTGEVRLYQEQIQKIISEAQDLDYLCINSIEDHVYDASGSASTLWSDVYVTGIQYDRARDVYVIKSGIETRNIINRERSTPEREKDFKLLYISDVEAVSDEQTNIEQNALLVVMIIIIVLIFLLLVFCIIAFICIKMAKTQEKRVIVQKSHKEQVPAPMPVMVAQEPAPVYDNRGFSAVEEDLVVEPGMYAQVQKKPPSPEPIRPPSPEPAEINVGFDDTDEPRFEVPIEDSPPPVRRTADEEYTIETQVM